MQPKNSLPTPLSNTKDAATFAKAQASVVAISAFSDNYIWLASDGLEAVVVDPGQAEPVVQYLQAKRLRLSAILITHEHFDHVGGVAALCTAFPEVAVFAPADIALDVSHTPVKAQQQVSLLGCIWSVLAIPGHTASHLGYYTQDFLHTSCLFCGDTLFAAGCGRVFAEYGGTMEALFQSLQTIKRLPSETLVFPAHEYTLTNARFAQSVQPEPTPAAQALFLEYARQRSANVPTLPSSIAQELESNPFLRANNLKEFVRLRQLRNVFS